MWRNKEKDIIKKKYINCYNRIVETNVALPFPASCTWFHCTCHRQLRFVTWLSGLSDDKMTQKRSSSLHIVALNSVLCPYSRATNEAVPYIWISPWVLEGEGCAATFLLAGLRAGACSVSLTGERGGGGVEKEKQEGGYIARLSPSYAAASSRLPSSYHCFCDAEAVANCKEPCIS